MKKMLFIFTTLLLAINTYSAEPPESECNWITNESIASLFVGDYSQASGAAIVITNLTAVQLNLDLGTNQGKMMYSMLLSAKLAEKTVAIYYCGAFNHIYRVSI